MNSSTCWQMSLALGLEAGGWGALVERASANGNPLLAHHGPNSFAGLAATLARRCGVCLATFPSAWLLERHALLQHAGQSNDNEKPFTCEQCGQRYRYRSAYVKHREQNHRARLPADKLFTCDVCGMQFRYLKSFKKHRLNHALERLQRATENIVAGDGGGGGGGGGGGIGGDGGDGGGGGGNSGIASSGGCTIGTLAAERNDQVSSTGEPSQLETRCDVTSPICNADELTRPDNVSKNCPREGNASESVGVREDHDVNDQVGAVERDGRSAIIGSVVGNEAADADEGNHDRVINDDRHGATERVMAAIVRSHDSDRRERRFACPFCGKCVRSKENLKLHVRKHTGERPFVCLFCGRAFGGKSDLTRHLRIHTGERPYHCEMCGKCFARADYLSKHLTTHIHQR